MEDKSIIYVSSIRRSAAAAIDISIVAILRIIFANTLGSLWFNQQILNFKSDFKVQFGTDIIARNQEHINFLTHHGIVKSMLLFYVLIILVGALYHGFLNSSSWSATVGKRLMNVILVRNEGSGMGFFQALAHYFLSLVPLVFMSYITLYQLFHNVTIYNAISENTFNLIFGILSVAWININVLTKKKVTVQDIICKTTMASGRVGDAYPKFRIKAHL